MSKTKCEGCGTTKGLTEVYDVEGFIFLCESCLESEPMYGNT